MPGLKEFLDEHRDNEHDFVELVCSLIFNTSVSYEDLFGAEYEVEKLSSDNFRVVKKGMPVEAMNILFERIQKEIRERDKESHSGRGLRNG